MFEEGKKIDVAPTWHIWVKIVIITLVLSWAAKMIVDYRNLPGNYPREITVSASHTMSFRPDLAVIDGGIRLENKDAVKIVKEANDKIKLITEELKKMDVLEEDVQLSDYNLNADYTTNDKGERNFSTYVLVNSLRIKIRDLDKVGQVLAKINEKGVNIVNSVRYQLEDPDKAKTEAISGAISKAQDKARSIASESGLELVKLVSYYEDAQPYYGEAAYGIGGGGSDGKGGSVANLPAGGLEVSAKVNLNYQVR